MSFLLCVVDGDKIPGKISETTKVRVMVLAIIAMLAVTMIVAGWQQGEEQDIEVEEGYSEIVAKVPQNPESLDIDNSTKSLSQINDRNNSLELSVRLDNWKGGSNDYTVEIFVSVESNLQTAFEPKALKIKARTLNAPNVSRNHLDFQRSHGETKNLTRWAPSKIISGVAGKGYCFDGFDIKNRNFQAEHILIDNQYELSEEWAQLESPITLEITAVMKGLSEDVTATVDVTFTQEEIE
ncbi:MAG: hypothetical protein ACLFU5_06595 [Thermoplasmata archaeon]